MDIKSVGTFLVILVKLGPPPPTPNNVKLWAKWVEMSPFGVITLSGGSGGWMDKSKADQRILVKSRVLWKITWKSLFHRVPSSLDIHYSSVARKNDLTNPDERCVVKRFSNPDTSRPPGWRGAVTEIRVKPLERTQTPKTDPSGRGSEFILPLEEIYYTHDRQPIDARTNWEI